MYGIIGVAVVTGVLGVQFIKRNNVKDIKGLPIEIADKEKGFVRYIMGGTLFGLGWGLVGRLTNFHSFHSWFLRNCNRVNRSVVRNLFVWYF